MKENRFIELLNLYIDRQIAPDEIAELEAEMQANPGRRKVYLKYCRMHHATKLVYESFRDRAAEIAPATAVASSGAITHLATLQQRRQRLRWLAYAGGLAAAACLTFPLARVALNRNSSPAGAALVAQAAAPVALSVPPAVVPRMVAVSAPSPVIREAHPGLLSLRNGNAQESVYVPVATILPQTLTVLNVPAQRMPSLFDDGVFDSKPLLPDTTGQVIYQSHGTLRQQAEFTGFQFQR